MDTYLYLEARSLGLARDSVLAFFLFIFLAGLFSIPGLNAYFEKKRPGLVHIVSGFFALVLLLSSFLALKDILPWLVNKEPVLQVKGQTLYLMEDPGQVQAYPLKSIQAVNLYEKEERSTDDLTSYYNSYIEIKTKDKDQAIYLPLDYFKDDPAQVKRVLGAYFSNFPHITMEKVRNHLSGPDSHLTY